MKELVERLLRYISIDTQSQHGSQTIPSTEKQKDLGRLLVKELLENAIDAQATAVTVEIREGGCSLIRITDNGCGIPKEEIPHRLSAPRNQQDTFGR